MNLSPELQSKMYLWRQRCVDGTISEADLTEAMNCLRGERKAAAAQTKPKRVAAAKAAIPNAKSLLDEMEEGDDA